MKGIFIRTSTKEPFPMWIMNGFKTAETRNRNMLKDLVGERVAIIATHRSITPKIIGYVDVVKAEYVKHNDFYNYIENTRVYPGSDYYPVPGGGKWVYQLRNREQCPVHDLPEDAVRHGRSWCEIEDVL